MKCIKLIKETKNNDIGTIIRVSDSEADIKVNGGNWSFVSKSEYKNFLYPNGQIVEKAEKTKKKK